MILGRADQILERPAVGPVHANQRTAGRMVEASYPDAGPSILAHGSRGESKLDVLLVNPPSPDGAVWIRCQHRVGRRSRENMIWPQVSLAQLAAMVHPEYSVEIVDAIATRMAWPAFERLLWNKRPRFYVTQVAAPTLTNDMHGVFLAKSVGARTVAFGTHTTPLPRETMERFPCLDLIIRGEPELTFKELVNALADDREDNFALERLSSIRGLVWRRGGDVIVNPDRPFISNLDDLPTPLHHLLPLDKYRAPMIKGPYTFIVTSRGCPAGCTFCIKHVNYQYSVRLRSAEKIQEELWVLQRLGIHNVHMYADLFTVNRDQVVGLCKLMIEQKIGLTWTCNSRVDYVDEEMLELMAKAGCNLISWGIESANEQILRKAAKGYRMEQAPRALTWARKHGIKNWGYFIIGLPGETVETIRETIDFAKKLPLDVALFHVAAPYPGTPFFFEVLENNWFRPGTQWEQVDMDKGTVLDYGGLKAEELEYWQKRAFREWAFRPGPILTFLKSINGPEVIKSALEIGIGSVKWALGKKEA
ncbi:MAG: B12-binding domain-containing radical SAM protein [Anaerolineae bacterium]|nr:B12-binding domain-containing radical SAM protein [Anaerolineae bacterium]